MNVIHIMVICSLLISLPGFLKCELEDSMVTLLNLFGQKKPFFIDTSKENQIKMTKKLSKNDMFMITKNNFINNENVFVIFFFNLGSLPVDVALQQLFFVIFSYELVGLRVTGLSAADAISAPKKDNSDVLWLSIDLVRFWNPYNQNRWINLMHWFYGFMLWIHLIQKYYTKIGCFRKILTY